MLFGEIVIVAFQSIRANLFRATLTMLGIIIGVGAVITMLAAGAGAQKRIDDQIAALSANILTINVSNFFSGGVSRGQQTLKIDDADALTARKRMIIVGADIPERLQVDSAQLLGGLLGIAIGGSAAPLVSIRSKHYGTNEPR